MIGLILFYLKNTHNESDDRLDWARQVVHPETYTQKQNDTAYHAYQKEVPEVEIAVAMNMDFEVLAAAFKRFPNLERVELILGGGSRIWEP